MGSPSISKEDDRAIQPRDVCIVGVARTPIGSFNGSLSSLPATKLGSTAIQGALEQSGLLPEHVQEVFFGNVLSGNLGQAPARQAALGAGIPNAVVCTTVNKVCASGMKAIMLAAQTIQLGCNDVVVAGGMESMSNAPYYLPKARQGYQQRNGEVIDGMMKDGLWDVYPDCTVGVCAEICAEQYGITREDQDNFSIQSYVRAINAQNSGAFTQEIVPVEIPGAWGKPSVWITKDEGIDKLDEVKLRKLQPAFKEGGSVTAGNSSSISDGAAALVLVSGKKAVEWGLNVFARLIGSADAAQDSQNFTTTPALAIPLAIFRAGIDSKHVDCYEINEAFSVVALANQKILDLKRNKHWISISNRKYVTR